MNRRRSDPWLALSVSVLDASSRLRWNLARSVYRTSSHLPSPGRACAFDAAKSRILRAKCTRQLPETGHRMGYLYCLYTCDLNPVRVFICRFGPIRLSRCLRLLPIGGQIRLPTRLPAYCTCTSQPADAGRLTAADAYAAHAGKLPDSDRIGLAVSHQTTANSISDSARLALRARQDRSPACETCTESVPGITAAA